MAKKPTDPFPSDESLRADVPPEPADLFDLDADTRPLSDVGDIEEISDADLFDFDEPVTEPIEAVRAADPPSHGDDILAWEPTPDGSSSFVGKGPADAVPTDRGSPVGGELGSGWLDSAVGLRNLPTPDDADPLADPAEYGPSASGVNLHDPDGAIDPGSSSSIFGNAAADQSSRIEIPLPPPSADAIPAVDAVGPASIWDEAETPDSDRMAGLRDEPESAIDWDAFKGLGAQVRQFRHDDEPAAPADELPSADLDLALDAEPAPAEPADWDAMKGLGAQVRQFRRDDSADDPQHTLRAPRPDLDAEPADDDLRAWLEEETRPVPKSGASLLSDTTGVGIPVGAKPPVPAPSAPRRPAPQPALGPEYDLEGDEDDEPVTAAPKRATPKPAGEKKGTSRAAAWIGGGIAGLLVGGGGVFGLSQLDMLPGQDAKPVVGTPPKGTPPDAGKLAELQKAADDAVAKLADAEAKAKEGEQAVADLAAAKDKEKTATDKLAVVQKAADKAGADLIEVTKKQLEAETNWMKALKDADTAMKDLVAAKDDLKAAAKDLTAAKDGLTAATKLAEERTKELADAQKKAKAGDDALAGLVKEFKAAKLIDADADAATALAALPDAARKAVAGASGDTKKLTDALAAAMKTADGLKANLKAAADDLAAAKADTDKALKAAEERTKELADAQKKAKAGDDALAGLVKEFKAAKLIDADADAATALAKLPDAAKKAASAAMSGDAAKAAEALVAAKKEVDAAQTALKKAETDLTAAKKEADTAKADAARLIDEAKADTAKALKAAQDDAAKAVAAAKTETDDKVKDAVAKAAADADAKVKAADAAAKTAEAKALAEAQARAAAEAKAKVAAESLYAKEVEFARQLAAVKAGAVAGGPAVPTDLLTQEKAGAAYSAGVGHYFAGRFADAEKELRAATAAAADARYSYFLGLVLLARGQAEQAADSFAAGAALERRNRPNARDVGEALERVQGAPRKELAKYRPM